jgi:hypothetical protein
VISAPAALTAEAHNNVTPQNTNSNRMNSQLLQEQRQQARARTARKLLGRTHDRAIRDAQKTVTAPTFVCQVAGRLPSCCDPSRPRRPFVAACSRSRCEERQLHVLIIHQRGVRLQHQEALVNIRFVSSMTDDDENRFAALLLKAMDELLSRLPIVYHVRIDTTTGSVLQRSRAVAALPAENIDESILRDVV